ncbi:MAG: hypothetical protein H6833_10850 [Planctomycetes bacterium]|nr:hypothetical protein [Planctomycetota bacterium]
MSTRAQHIRFYSAQAVFMAVSLGTPIAGAILMSWNCKAFPQEAHRARRILWLGLLGTVLVFTVDYVFQNATVHLLLCALAGIGMHRWTSAQRRRLPAVEFDVKGSGLSVLVGACVGMACLILIVLGLWGIEQLSTRREFHKLSYGAEQEIFVHEDATDDEARRLARALETIGWWGAKKKGAVSVLREEGRPAVHVIVGDGAWQEPEALADASRLGAKISEAVYEGRPIFLSLCDKSWKIQMRVDVPGAPQGPPR